MILVFVEHNAGDVDSRGLQTLTFAKHLSNEKNLALEVVSFGDTDVSATAKRYGASKIHYIKADTLVQYAPEAWAQSLGQLAEVAGATFLLAPAIRKSAFWWPML